MTFLPLVCKQDGFHPHITVAYANADGVPAADAIAAVEELNATADPVSFTVSEATLALLDRREHSYD